jgi:hypothetical protein
MVRLSTGFRQIASNCEQGIYFQRSGNFVCANREFWTPLFEGKADKDSTPRDAGI